MASFFETVFVGGGISCLAAARHHRGDWILLEREPRVGGLCRSDAVGNFVFDRTGHLLHLRDPGIRAWIGRLLRGNLQPRIRNSWIFSHGVYTRYPFQSHFHGLPAEVATECLLGVIEAARVRRLRRIPLAFADFVRATFGSGVARHFMFPYNRKLWTVPPQQLTTGWMGRFVPQPDLEQVILGALSDRPDDAGYNARFLYPVRGGIESLVRSLAKPLKGVRCSAGVSRIDLSSRRVRLASGDEMGFGRLVTCAPLPELVRMTNPLPDRVREAASRLRWASVYNLNLGIRDTGCDRHWVYVPEDRFAFYRFGYMNNFSSHVAPPGAANIYTEVAYGRNRPLDRKGIRRRVIRDLRDIGVIRSRRDVLETQEFDLTYAYAIYDRNRSRAVSTIINYLESHDIYPIGRYGRWEYGTMEDALLQGVNLARRWYPPAAQLAVFD